MFNNLFRINIETQGTMLIRMEKTSRSRSIPSQHFYPQNTMHYPNDRNNMYQGVNFQRNNPLKNTRYCDYSRNVASRNPYVPNHD